MEDLYSDLENYQYENIVSELKTENEQLKCKLEEYASTLGSLQKDFDKLSTEYKKLEANYSSLLKTARAEIERKSLMITNLNIEKDKLVIEAMQNRGRIQNRKNYQSNKQYMGKQPAKQDLSKTQNEAPNPDTVENVSGTLKHQKKEKSDKNIYSREPGIKHNPNIKEKEQKSKNDLSKVKEKNPNEIKKRKENHSDSEKMEKHGHIASTDNMGLSLDPSVKDNYKHNEYKSKKIESYKNTEENKSEIKNTDRIDSDFANSGEVPQKTSSKSSTLKNQPQFEESDLKSMQFDACAERGKNESDIKKGIDIYSDMLSNDDVTNIEQSTISNLKDKSDIKENELKFNNIDECKNKENKKTEMNRSKASDVSSYSGLTNTVSKIRSRRKSMPLLNRGDFQYSSDEDQDDISRDRRFRRKSPLRNERIYNDKYRDRDKTQIERKVPDLIRMGDRHTNSYDSSRDFHRKSNTWHRNNDRYKNRDNRDNYEPGQRSRRNYSPERPCDIQGEYYNKYRESYDRPYKFDNMRQRTLVSPPPDKYNQRQRSRESDGQRFQHEVINPMKHKLNDVFEEPICKRLRSELINNPPDKHLFDRDHLQSPDYIYSENYHPGHQIKEIRSTSDTKLDDPRLKSKKYVVSTHSDKVALSTIVGRDVDVKAIDKTKWNKEDNDEDKEIYEMPALLKEKPSISEDFVKEIYMDIDNPMANISLESGEISTEEEVGIISEKFDKTTAHTIQKNSNNKNDNIQPHNQIDTNLKKEKEQAQRVHNEQTCTMTALKNYHIPKINKTDNPKVTERDSLNSRRNKHKRDSTTHAPKKRNTKEKRKAEKKLQQDSPDFNSSKNKSDTMDVCKMRTTFKHREYSPEKHIISARDTVEGDLELSDETCDYDVPEQSKHDEGNKAVSSESNKNIAIDNIKRDLIIGKTEKSQCTLFKDSVERTCENKRLNIPQGENVVEPKDSISNANMEQKPKDIKSKLCDLFGDTSSLITLDDLGITPSTTKGNVNEYAPVFENTQDAVDFNVEEMEKVQAGATELKHDKDGPITKDAKKNVKCENTESATKKETKKSNNHVENSSSMQHVFENITKVPEDNNFVKTVIMSTGIQNAYQTGNARDSKQEKLQPIIERKINDNATISPAPLSIKALATSTPYKPQNESTLSVPETSCSSSNSTIVKDVARSAKVAPSNQDVPDLRIMVKRRRKVKAAPT